MSRFVRASLLVAVATLLANAKTEEWLEIRTPHFVVVANSNEKQARRVADQFERMRFVFRKAFPNTNVDPGSPIIVLAVKDKKGFQALEPEAYLAKGQLQLAGLFLRAPDKNYVLLRLDAEGEHPYSTVYHEYTHLLISRAEEWLPLWLNEGLAQFYENTDIREKDVELGQPSAGALYLLQQNKLLPLSILFAVDRDSPYYHEENKGSVFYAESWALTHYLLVKDFQEKTHRIPDYAKLVSTHVDPVTAATTAFGDLKKLQSDLESYISRSALTYFKLQGGTDVDDSAFKVRALTLTQADAVRADFLAYNQRFKDSRTLLDRILQEDPNNVLAHETMGFLAFREGKLPEAQHWYEQAVKLDSQSYLAHYYFAAITMREETTNPDTQNQIEASLKAATKLNPSFAPAYDEQAIFYGMRHKNLEDAHTASLMAVQLDPSNIGYRLNAANVLMQMERPKDAIAVLQAALKLATKPEQTAMIQSQMESVQHFQDVRERMAKDYRQATEDAAHQESGTSEPEDSQATPDRPEDDRHGPQRVAKGTITNVRCSYPAKLTLKLGNPTQSISLRARNYYKIQFSALNFTSAGDLNPCKDIEGMKAKIGYFEPLSPTTEGQIVSIELSK